MVRLLAFVLAAVGLCALPPSIDAALIFLKQRASTYIGPGDVRPGAFAWYGLRAYSAAIAASGTFVAVKLQRVSDGSSCFLVIQTSGDLSDTVSSCTAGGTNGTPVATWCASTNCLITFVDQLNNTLDLSPGGTAPILRFNCIGTKRCVDFGGNGYVNNATKNVQSGLSAFSQSILARNNGTSAYLFNTQRCSDDLQSSLWGSNTVGIFDSAGFIATAAGGQFHAMNMRWGASSAGVISVDGTETTGSTGTLSNFSGITIGSSNGGGCSQNANMYFAEGGIWESAFSPADRTALCRNQQAYYGTSNFPATC